MTDIEGREISIGDEVIASPSGWYGIIRMKIIKETAAQIKYLKYDYQSQMYDFRYEYKMNKSSYQAVFYKI